MFTSRGVQTFNAISTRPSVAQIQGSKQHHEHPAKRDDVSERNAAPVVVGWAEYGACFRDGREVAFGSGDGPQRFGSSDYRQTPVGPVMGECVAGRTECGVNRPTTVIPTDPINPSPRTPLRGFRSDTNPSMVGPKYRRSLTNTTPRRRSPPRQKNPGRRQPMHERSGVSGRWMGFLTAEGGEGNSEISPDGQWIAYQSNENGEPAQRIAEIRYRPGLESRRPDALQPQRRTVTEQPSCELHVQSLT
jgi:hypothetical protein